MKIHLPALHPKQKQFVNSPAKRKVICAGRRAGKTTGVADLSVERLLENRRILYAAPTQDQTDAYWTKVKRYLREPIEHGIIYKNETNRLLELPNGSRLRAKTAWNADGLRGDYADLLILEEYSIMEPDTWDEVGAPMLLDNDGDAVFIFTPKRKNHAFQIFQKAVQDTSGRWASWHFTSHDNPYLNKFALEEITKDMTEEAIRQEILAEFLEGEGAVFRNIHACMLARGGGKHVTLEQGFDYEQTHKHFIVAGVDWGKQNDFTAISIGCADCHEEITLDRFNQIDFHLQRDRLAALFKKHKVDAALVELNSIGQPNFEELTRMGLPVAGFNTTAQSKPPLIENLALALEKEEWQFIPDEVGISELEAYERTVNANTGRPSYGCPSGLHDDTVIARSLMLRAAGNKLEILQSDSDLMKWIEA